MFAPQKAFIQTILSNINFSLIRPFSSAWQSIWLLIISNLFEFGRHQRVTGSNPVGANNFSYSDKRVIFA